MATLAATFAVSAPHAGAITQYNDGILNFTDTGAVTMAYGGDEIVNIALGQIHYIGNTSGCTGGGIPDFVVPAADIYVIPVGELPGLMVDFNLSKHSVNHAPSGVARAASDGSFWDTTIAATKPTGSLGTGTYAVVYDECQNGVLGPEDDIFSPLPNYPQGASDVGGFSVQVPSTTIPTLPNAQILAMKNAAKAEGDQMVHLAAFVTAIAVAQAVQDFAKKAAAGGAQKTVKLIKKAAKWQPPVVMQAALFAVLTQVKKDIALYQDPPDPNFQQPAVLPGRPTIDQNDPNAMTAAIEAAGQAAGNEGALGQALLDAVQRYQGAAAAQDSTWALVHAHEVQRLAAAWAAQLTTSESALSSLSTAIQANATDLDATATDLQSFRADIAANGFDASETQMLENLGFSASDIADAQASIASLSTAFSSANAVTTLTSAENAMSQQATAMNGLASAMSTVITQLTADTTVAPAGPTVSAGGPYAGTAGSPVALAANGTDPAGGGLTYGWDLGSGTFTDATGASVNHAWPQNFDGWVGVQATDAVGRTAESYAHVTITGGNQPPAIDIVSPVPALATATVGGSGAALSVSVSDAESDPVSVSWTVDGQPTAATGTDFTYSPSSPGDVGLHDVDAVAIDSSHPERGSSTAIFTVEVLLADNDGDGWTATTDCNDNDAAVHPGLTEIAFTGVSESCNNATPDFPPGSAVSVAAPASAAQGAPVSVTATITAPGDSVAGSPVALAVTGANPQTLNSTTNTNGVATFSYPPANQGNDSFQATVSGIDGAGNPQSVSSSVATVNVAAPGPPGAPQNVQAQGGEASATVSWQPPLSGAVDSYTVTITDPANPAATEVHTGVLSLTDSFGSLTDGTQYDISVLAVNNTYGSGPAVTVPATPAPLTPTAITVTPLQQWNPQAHNALVTATVTNAGGTPLPGVAVDFTITGRNTQTFANLTDGNGAVPFAYTDSGSSGTTDTVIATVDGTAITTTATANWTPTIATAPTSWPIGVAVTRDRILVSEYDGTGLIDAIDSAGNISTFAHLPIGGENYLAISPGLGGFAPDDVYTVSGDGTVWHITADGSQYNLLATLPGGATSEGITFDEVGTFGNRLIVTSTDGGAWAIDPAGNVSKIGQFPEGPAEGPAVAPLSFTAEPGRLLVAEEGSGNVYAMDATGNSSLFANVPSAEAVHIVPQTVCGFGSTGSSWFIAQPTEYTLAQFPTSAFTNAGGDVLVTGELSGEATILKSTPSGVAAQLIATGFTQVEGSGFTDCAVPTIQELHAPGAPKNLAAPPADGATKATWQPPLDHGSTAIDRYEATISFDGTVMATVLVTDLGTLQAAFPSLVDGQTYSVAVRAHNSIGWGPTATTTTTPVAPPLVKAPVGSLPVPALGATAPTNAPLAADYAPAVVDTDAAITSWTLSFGDGSSTSGTGEPTAWIRHTYATAGPFTATLSVTDSNGRSASVTAPVTITRTTIVDNPPTITAPATVDVVPGGVVQFNATVNGPESGDTVTLAASGLPNGLTFPARVRGTGTATGAVAGVAPSTPGSYTITFTGQDGHNNPVTATTNVNVAKDDCTLTPPPAIFTTAASPTTLSATMADTNATSTSSVANKTISFTATDSNVPAGSYGPYTALTNTTGLASTNVNWGANVYTVDAGFAGDAGFNPCSTSYPVVVTVAAAQAKATGGGWVSNGTGRTAFGFNAVSDVTGLHGQLQVRTANKQTFHGDTIASLTGTSTSAQWSGTGTWNGTPNYRYSVSVSDAGSRSKASDTISITITSPTGAAVFSTNGSQKLKGGNIVVH